MPMGFYGSGVTVAEISAVANDITAIPALAGCIHVQTCADTCTPNSESAIPGELLGKFTAGPGQYQQPYVPRASFHLVTPGLSLSVSVCVSVSVSLFLCDHFSVAISLY